MCENLNQVKYLLYHLKRKLAMSFVKTKGFKYFKNLIIGVGAAIVLMGALFKLESWKGASEMLIIGLSIEAIISIKSKYIRCYLMERRNNFMRRLSHYY